MTGLIFSGDELKTPDLSPPAKETSKTEPIAHTCGNNKNVVGQNKYNGQKAWGIKEVDGQDTELQFPRSIISFLSTFLDSLFMS